MNYYDIATKKACRKAKYVVYLKSAEEVSTALSLIGAGNAVLKLEEARIRKDFRKNRINRRMNCDSSNIDRVMAASSAQIEDIRYLEKEMGLELLPKNLEIMARLRAGKPGSVSGFAGRAAGAADWAVRRERPSAQNIGDCAQSPLRGGYAPRKLTVKEKNDGQIRDGYFPPRWDLRRNLRRNFLRWRPAFMRI